jgi:hypothetical protein
MTPSQSEPLSGIEEPHFRSRTDQADQSNRLPTFPFLEMRTKSKAQQIATFQISIGPG